MVIERSPQSLRTSAIVIDADCRLETARLLLRPLAADDVDMIWPDISDPQISRLMAWEAHESREQTVAFLENEAARRRQGNGITWAILEGERFCGIISLISLLRTHRALTYNKAELAYWLSRSMQRQGIMTEAGQRVLSFAFDDLGLHKLYVSHFAENTASQELIRRLGFRRIGVQREEFQKGGIWYDHVMYELLDREYAVLTA